MRRFPAIGICMAMVLSHVAVAQEPGKAGARPARPTIALHSGGAADDLTVLRETLKKLVGVKFNADDVQFADFGKDGGLFTKFLRIEIADHTKTDIGMIAKAVASANTSKKERNPPTLFLVLRYKPGSTKNEPFRMALADVKGVQAAKSWAGDQNLWVSVDGSGQARLAEITRALHGAGIPIRDPITDIGDQP